MASAPFFIVNPRSAGGDTGRHWEATLRPRLEAAFPGSRFALTTGPGHAAALAIEAADRGAPLVVAVGGDGTVNEVVNGLMGLRLDPPPPGAEAPDRAGGGAAGRNGPALGIIPRGTGCDFARGLRVPRNLAGALAVLRAGRTVAADLCEMRFRDGAGREVLRYSMNMCGCGATGEVARRVNRAGRPQHGLVAFLLASLRAALVYRPRTVLVSVDGGAPRTVRLKALFVCNGEYCGGGMRVGRGARIDDGVLRIVEVGAVGPIRSLLHLYRLYTGHVAGVSGVSVFLGRSVQVASDGPLLVDCDGEQPGVAPASFAVRPGCLRICIG